MSYNLRIQEIVQGPFTPLVCSSTGAMAKECSMFYTHCFEKKERFFQKASVLKKIFTRKQFIGHYLVASLCARK